MAEFTVRSLLMMLGSGLFGLLSSCAPAPRIEGALPSTWSQIPPKTFVIGRPPGPETGPARRAREAVTQWLARFGFEEDANGRFRVETSFSMRPVGVVIGGPRPRHRISPPALCRRVSYALSILVTDRATGAQLLRRSAQAARCSGKEEQIAGVLADLVFEDTAVGR